MEQFGQFFNDLIYFFEVGIDDLFSQTLIYLGKLLFYSAIEAKIYFVKISFAISQEVLTDLNVHALVESSYNSLDSQTLAITNFFRIPDFIRNILGAYTTRFVMSVIL